jgi:hypothetical protein
MFNCQLNALRSNRKKELLLAYLDQSQKLGLLPMLITQAQNTGGSGQVIKKAEATPRARPKAFVHKRKASSSCVGVAAARPSLPIARQALQLQAAYFRERKDWLRPSAAFASRAPRIPPSPSADAAGGKNNNKESSDGTPPLDGVIERLPVFRGQYTAPVVRANTAGPAFRSTAQQRPESKPLLCDRLATPRTTLRVAPKSRHAPAFGSTGPRIVPQRKLLPAQHELSYAVPPSPSDLALLRRTPPPTSLAAPGSKGRLVGNMSAAPRLIPPRKAVCETWYQDVTGKEWLLPSSKIRSFVSGAMPQRPTPKPNIATQLSYDPQAPLKSTDTGNPMPKSTSRRFATPRTVAPPVGTYTSRFVSCGLQC